MNEKLTALKTLGFNYITRDMDRKVIAWMGEPQRLIYCSKDKVDEIKGKYGKNTIVNYFTPESESEQNQVRHGSFVFSRIEDQLKLWDYGRLQLYDPNNEFKDITWENSPFEIP